MTLSQQLVDYIHAGFSGLWIQTHEPDEALREITQLAREQAPSWSLHTWDIALGCDHQGEGDPLWPLKHLPAASPPHLVVLVFYHRFLQNPVVVQNLFNQVILGKQVGIHYLILSPLIALPPELEKLFVVLEHPLPSFTQLVQIMTELVGTPPESSATLASAASGLTRYEAEGAFALSLARHGTLQPSTIWELKESLIKKSGLLTLYRGQENFDELGGLSALKRFCTQALAHTGSVRPRGTLLLGVPGTGKSAFAKALGAETGRPTLVLDMGALLGSLVGQSEGNLRSALRTVDAMAPAILFVDEVEKALSGVQSSGAGDSGVTARLFGTLLTWLNDHRSDVFVVCTCNDISQLPPEFSRAERFDGVFFLDLPTESERRKIWDIYLRHYGRSLNQERPDDEDWTGAEIRACCRLSALLSTSLTEAADLIIPIAHTAATKVVTLREWASHRCLDASRGGIYQYAPSRPSSRTTSRRIHHHKEKETV